MPTPAVFLFAWLFFFVAPAMGAPVILAFGDSLTAGFGVNQQESYPARLQSLLKEEGYSYKVVNAGVSGDTTAGGLRRIDWLLKHKPSIVILELGANDGLRGLPLEEMESNLETIILTCQKQGARVLLAGMKIPPNYGEDYTKGFETVFSKLAEKHGTGFIPFFLENVAAVQELTRPDGIHPVGEGYAVVVQTVWEYLKPMLERQEASR
ncbi:MAG: arylesterase [Candidatus Nitronauta litoralis]|uniref:Arylesterase n=1 Tax=Candidatus Nitronauta litoralis TaxID=2705533 RepID=A0A7T0G0G3_9BACT|nr:MAG: arylesterase [Candidatus Nitronauta litoralis]